MNLIDLAKKARLNAYAPYSNFLVGAALLMKDGKVISGCNVENSSYGLSMCAERNALFQMIALGYKKGDVEEMVVVGDTEDPISPCGACRQVMVELLDSKTKIVLSNLKGEVKTLSIEDLLPYSFKELK